MVISPLVSILNRLTQIAICSIPPIIPTIKNSLLPKLYITAFLLIFLIKKTDRNIEFKSVRLLCSMDFQEKQPIPTIAITTIFLSLLNEPFNLLRAYPISVEFPTKFSVS